MTSQSLLLPITMPTNVRAMPPYGLAATALRLTNVYGPRQLIKHNRQGFIGWFIRLALEGRQIEIFGVAPDPIRPAS